MQIGVQENSLSDIPQEGLKQILALVPKIDLLQTRSELAVVSRSFASAVRELQTVTILTQNRQGTSQVLSQAAKEHSTSLLGRVRHVQLATAEMHGYARMLQAAMCCPAMQTLTITVEGLRCWRDPWNYDGLWLVEQLADHLWPLLTQHIAELLTCTSW